MPEASAHVAHLLDQVTTNLVALGVAGKRHDALVHDDAGRLRPDQEAAPHYPFDHLVPDRLVRAAENTQRVSPADDPDQAPGLCHGQSLEPPVSHETGGLHHWLVWAQVCHGSNGPWRVAWPKDPRGKGGAQ